MPQSVTAASPAGLRVVALRTGGPRRLGGQSRQLNRLGALAERYFRDDPSTRQLAEALAQQVAAGQGTRQQPGCLADDRLSDPAFVFCIAGERRRPRSCHRGDYFSGGARLRAYRIDLDAGAVSAVLSIGDYYRLAYRLIHAMGQPRAIGLGACVIIGLAAFSGGSFGEAIPYAVVWMLACGTMRLVIIVLRRPTGQSIVPIEKPLPKAASAVSITPPFTPDACPNRAEMVARLPSHVRELIR